ncbi:hypothetical protein GXM_02578 [Nostoc sphaeroides CCNUC1]|uniref:Uncharacterized protein n=1 Tax=Nostoc sphaeroides CCNUC1 TaxID=2653204 RepID=A0A5P8VXF6_9NOSO|nr:hypothetical protein GXM_02578 [Nostoc sphaeroides CCNUC1]
MFININLPTFSKLSHGNPSDYSIFTAFIITLVMNFGGLSPLSLQAARFVSGYKSPSQNVIANCELRIANWFNQLTY